MNKQKSKTEKLDQVAYCLLESARIKDDEIEKIIAAPQLFSLVKARIEEQRSAQTTESSFFLFLNWQRVGFSFAALAILLVGLLSLSLFDNYSSLNFETAEIIVPEIQLSNSTDENSLAYLVTIESQALSKSIGLTKATKLPKPAPKRNKRQMPEAVEEEREFYPLTFAGEDFQEDAQIIRVELPRESLIALGVNPPTESAAAKFKTELLVGSDGVTRGIRFVN